MSFHSRKNPPQNFSAKTDATRDVEKKTWRRCRNSPSSVTPTSLWCEQRYPHTPITCNPHICGVSSDPSNGTGHHEPRGLAVDGTFADSFLEVCWCSRPASVGSVRRTLIFDCRLFTYLPPPLLFSVFFLDACSRESPGIHLLSSLFSQIKTNRSERGA